MKRNFFFLIIILSFISMYATHTVAIMDFKPKGVDANSVSIVTDLFRDMLFGKHLFTVVDRASMQQILKEQNLQQSLGCNSEECAVQIGRILGVNSMIIGTLGKLGDAYILSIRMVSIENAKIVWAKTAKIYDFNRIDEGVSALADDLVNLYLAGKLGMAPQQPAPVQQQSQQVVQQPAPVQQQPQQVVQQPAPVQQQSQQVQQKPVVVNKGGQNVTIIMQGNNEQTANQNVAPTKRYIPKSPPVGFDLQLGFSFLYFYHYDYYCPSVDYDYNESSKQSFFHLKFDAYFSGLNLGFNLKSFTTKEGSILDYSDNGTTGSGTMTVDWKTSFVDFSIGYRMKGGAAGFSTFSLIYRSMTSDNFSNATFSGLGLDLFFRAGGINNRYTKNTSPIGGIFEMDLNGAYLFYNTDELTYTAPNFSALFGGSIGFGIVIKPIGAYLLIGYDINMHYTTWDDANIFIIQHGLEMKLGVNFDFQSILG